MHILMWVRYVLRIDYATALQDWVEASTADQHSVYTISNPRGDTLLWYITILHTLR